MSKNLVIVESPAKAKTIEKYLGQGYKVEASYGHIRDLPKGDLGIDVENNFEPRYVIPTKARKRVNALKKEIESAETLFLATDPDREGEAIAWHISNISENHKTPKRVVFTEITESAIREAFSKPREIDERLVDAQQGRRVLDRLVGYNLSPLLWKKVRRGLSAGRVQSVAVRLIVERERERLDFKQEEYWQIEAILSKKEDTDNKFSAKLFSKDGKRLSKLSIINRQEADSVKEVLESGKFIVEGIEEKESKKNPYPPFTTSTLQQSAARNLGFTAKKTMMLAQQLYEGILLGGEGQTGLITYMRTDSLHLSADFISSCSAFIKEEYGEQYSIDGGRHFKSKSKNAQEAHEAIRPTYIERKPVAVKEYLTPDQLKLYTLIYNRALSSQMKEAKIFTTSVDIKCENFGLRATGSRIVFDGFLKVSQKAGTEEQILPKMEKQEELLMSEIITNQSFTQPPARYSEASLVKMLEENGIGRPSTYAPIMSTIVDRGYVRREQKYFIPEDIAYTVTDGLVKCFPELVDVSFTAKMENELDEIAQGTVEWKDVVKDFYSPFSQDLKRISEEGDDGCFPEKQIVYVKECPLCKENKCASEKAGDKKPHMIMERFGRFGKFLGCSCYPDCKYIEKLPDKEIGIKCPECGGNIIEKRTRRGKVFYGCSGYPKCNFATWYKPTGEECPQCKKILIEKGKNIVCIECDYKQEK